MYDQREKAIRDHEWSPASVRKEGLEKGRQEGMEKGREEGVMSGRIQMIQELLGEQATPSDELLNETDEELSEMLTSLQRRVPNLNRNE